MKFKQKLAISVQILSWIFNVDQIDWKLKFFFVPENLKTSPMEDKSEKEDAVFAKVRQVDPHFRFRGQAFPVREEVASGRQIVPFFHQNTSDNEETEKEEERILKNLVLNDVLENVLESLNFYGSNLERNSPQKRHSKVHLFLNIS